jgi:hypothetical protein
LYIPTNGYIERGGTNLKIYEHDLDGLPAQWEPLHRFDNHEMTFTDCSGFIQHIARSVHSDHPFFRLQDKRQMSYHLAPIFDTLANAQKRTSDRFYDITGIDCGPLTLKEKGEMTKYEKMTQSMMDVYEAVLNPLGKINPLDDMQAGDIIIKRGKDEGHVTMVVQKEDKNWIIVVELTTGGYKWNKIRLEAYDEQSGNFYQILRIKTPNKLVDRYSDTQYK